MSISYHGIVGSRKVTLPSVDSWGTNKNIIRDPPKSIHTRRRDKVNEGGDLNEMFYHSGDRFADTINVYARGVNPSVSVEYSNSGVKSGNNAVGLAGVVAGGNAKMPYRILDYGAFRPPMLTQEQLLPLSRLPRNVTSAKTNRETIDYAKTISCAREKTKFREVNPEIIHVETNPTIYRNIARPMKEHFEVNYVIDNPVHYSVAANFSSNLNSQPIEVITPTKHAETEVLKYSRQTNKSGIKHVEFEHNEIELERNMPIGQMTTNNSSSSMGIDVGSRNFNRIHPSVSRGGFEGVGTKPQLGRTEMKVSSVSNHGIDVMKSAALQMQERRN